MSLLWPNSGNQTDNDDFEPRSFRAPVSDKWEGEDEDDDVKVCNDI